MYTIRFQNTGNDTAFRVVLRDQLSIRLKPESFELVGSSHPCKVKIENGKDVSWTFENINLPDSSRNEAASHGYVSFRIRPVSGLNVLDTIRNFAAIYFDYNEPVITNTEVTVIRDVPLHHLSSVACHLLIAATRAQFVARS
ncbi:MAG: hypothetical protein IPP79_03315 [Chitinophagaceae bacterium]|nr:hypothetical protein [Chitinophagaceae bacterium]